MRRPDISDSTNEIKKYIDFLEKENDRQINYIKALRGIHRFVMLAKIPMAGKDC